MSDDELRLGDAALLEMVAEWLDVYESEHPTLPEESKGVVPREVRRVARGLAKVSMRALDTYMSQRGEEE